MDYRDLTGPELKRFQNIKISVLLQRSEAANGLQVIWDDFIDLIKELNKDYTTEQNISEMKGRIDFWFQEFWRVYQGCNPLYAWIGNHGQEFLKLYKNIE